MIYKCPNCGGALKFDSDSQKMLCEYCISYFAPEEVVTKVEKEELEVTATAEAVNYEANSDDYMECNVYSCTSCGGELVVNGVETSTFCAYCGQPTIVFNRVSKELKPQQILPFSVTKEEAIDAIRQTLNKGLFVPTDIKNFETERIRGIYIPYWLCDVDYADRQTLKGTVGSGKNERTYYYYRKARCAFRNMTLDASVRLNDETSQRLEPYNIDMMRDFDMSYLSGFYADRYDVNSNEIEYYAKLRAKALFDEEVKKTVSADDVGIIRSTPTSDVIETRYALLPAWFLTFRYEGEAYTFLVNGQTRKVVGAVPYDKQSVRIWTGALGLFFSLLLTIFFQGILNSQEIGESEMKLIMGILVMGISTYMIGKGKFSKVKKSIELTKSKVMMKFVKERQEES